PRVAVLLRLNWWPHMPEDIPEPVILPFRSRPSFTAHLRWVTKVCGKVVPGGQSSRSPKLCQREMGHDGDCMPIGTDSCEYAWLLWGVDPEDVTGRSVLPATSSGSTPQRNHAYS